MWTKQQVVLCITKYISYGLNILLVAGVLGLGYFWVSTLILAAK